MPMTPGLSSALRLLDPVAPVEAGGDDGFMVEIAEDGPSVDTDDAGNIMRIEHPDGSISISLDGKPIERAEESEAERAKDWFRNLVDDIDDGELGRIAEDLTRGIRDDIDSRKEWIEDRAQGIKLLGLKIEIPGLAGAADGAPVEGMSKVRHPLLLEAVLRFQANARSEMLPTDGPVKVRIDASSSYVEQDRLGDALEKDLNHYLTSTASEYYPDTDRMLLMLGFGGSSFKKIYYCPLRNRPVSESVDANDLIVNNSATDLRNAKRITHRVFMRPSTVKRLQILGVYRDIDLSTPKAIELDSVQREEAAQQGISTDNYNPNDRDREIYECYCELDIGGFEHKYKGKVSGLEIPYRVTVDASTKEILSIVRNYDEDDAELPMSRSNFVKFTFVPGMGFYDIGLLHILGNTTNAVTAAWREMLDAGMYANFPGFLMADSGARQNTNIFRIPPGGGATVKTGGMSLRDAIMPLPYKEPGGALMSLVQNIAETGMRVGGTSEMQVGEGRADAPVGTTLALIDQATKIMNAVHKRMHASQAEEFALLVRTFREHPDSFWQRAKKPAYPWDEQTFVQALNDYELVPQADPNTASHTQRLMKVAALKQLSQGSPNLYNQLAIDTAALKAMGWSNPEQFFATPEIQNQTPPEIIKGLADIEVNKKKADAAVMDAQTRAQDVQIKAQDNQTKLNSAQAKAAADNLRAQTEKMKVQNEIEYSEREIRSQNADRASKERIQLIDLAQNLAVHPYSAELVAPLVQPAMEEIQEQEAIENEGITRPRGDM